MLYLFFWYSACVQKLNNFFLFPMTAFLARDDYNVIIVDWSNIAKLNYPESVERVKAVGGYIAKMIDFLKSLGNDPNNMSLVGHSLGAHVMGLAGNQASNKVGHVVGSF